jgi:hypothetical protein
LREFLKNRGVAKWQQRPRLKQRYSAYRGQ